MASSILSGPPSDAPSVSRAGWRQNADVPATRITPRAALAAAVTIAVGLLTLAHSARAASLTVRSGAVGAPIPTGFLGISTEIRNLESYAGSNPKSIDPAFLNLLSAISPGQAPVLRIGGDSTDWSWYRVDHRPRPPGVTFTIDDHWLSVARATAQALHAKLILGVNLEASSKADAKAEADAMVSRIGRRYIQAMEIGNEPELYTVFAWYHTRSGRRVLGRPKSEWTPGGYRSQFRAFAHAMPDVPLAGPTSGQGLWLDELGTFLRDEPFVRLTTIHAYPLKHCTPSHIITVPQLLSGAASIGFARQVTPFVDMSHRHGTPIRIDEVNAISCGGTRNVSNSFASALWMLDTLFALARTGVDGINVHTVPGTINGILDTRDGHGAIGVQPEYYAMMMFAQAAPPGARLLRLSQSLGPRIEAWATRDQSGTMRVVLINKRARAGETVSLRVPSAAGPATIERLRAPSLSATGGVTLGGQTFGAATRTGRLTGTPTTTSQPPIDGTYEVGLPPGSAAMVTLYPPAAKTLLSALAAPQLLGPLLSSW